MSPPSPGTPELGQVEGEPGETGGPRFPRASPEGFRRSSFDGSPPLTQSERAAAWERFLLTRVTKDMAKRGVVTADEALDTVSLLLQQMGAALTDAMTSYLRAA